MLRVRGKWRLRIRRGRSHLGRRATQQKTRMEFLLALSYAGIADVRTLAVDTISC